MRVLPVEDVTSLHTELFNVLMRRFIGLLREGGNLNSKCFVE